MKAGDDQVQLLGLAQWVLAKSQLFA
jgi:hypothetical protein